jgi:hypothetical protein
LYFCFMTVPMPSIDISIEVMFGDIVLITAVGLKGIPSIVTSADTITEVTAFTAFNPPIAVM